MQVIAFDIGSALGLPDYLTRLTGIGDLVSVFLSNAIVLAGVIFLFLIILAGISMLSAQGDPQKFQQAQNIITAAVLGFIIVIAAFLIVRLIERSLSINILD